jgi:hypothetical protein
LIPVRLCFRRPVAQSIFAHFNSEMRNTAFFGAFSALPLAWNNFHPGINLAHKTTKQGRLGKKSNLV